jgi:DNA-binding CsgD family transcriptional regulator
LLLPFILPLGLLRSGARPRGLSKRLVLLGLLFLPILVLQAFGFSAWLESPVNAAARGFTNGVILALVQGLFISLAGKRRNLWAGFSLALSFFVYHLALSIRRNYQGVFFAPALFYGAGLLMVIIAVFLYVYLSSLPADVGRGSPPAPPPEPAVLPAPGKRRRFSFLFLIFAAAVIFWANSFTERLFMPAYHLPSGLHPANAAMMAALLVGGHLADRFRRKFLTAFIYFSFGVFLLAPSLLQFSNLETVFLVLYPLSAASILLIGIVFPFAIVDLYWKESRPGAKGYWAWLLANSIYLLRVLAGGRIGLFGSFPFDGRYSVLLLSFVVIVYFALAFIFIRLQSEKAGTGGNNASANTAMPEDDFREHGLSKREMEIGSLVLQGMRNTEISKRLFIEEVTVKKHINSIFDKYKVKGRPEFMAKVLNK